MTTFTYIPKKFLLIYGLVWNFKNLILNIFKKLFLTDFCHMCLVMNKYFSHLFVKLKYSFDENMKQKSEISVCKKASK